MYQVRDQGHPRGRILLTESCSACFSVRAAPFLFAPIRFPGGERGLIFIFLTSFDFFTVCVVTKMQFHSLALADVHRVRQFSLLSTSNVFSEAQIKRDEVGILWLVGAIGDDRFGISLLGEGWHFNASARTKWSDKHQARLSLIRGWDESQQEAELRGIADQFRFGPRSERLVWKIHQELLRQRASTVQIAECDLCKRVWPSGPPKHWRGELRKLLKSLSLLHLCRTPADRPPLFGDNSSVLTHFKVRERIERSDCPRNCSGPSDQQHGHVLVNVGIGFLGCLEQCGGEASGAVRPYLFPEPADAEETRKTNEKRLKSVGKSGNLMSMFLPAKLGADDAVKSMSGSQHRLFQCIFRERGRCSEKFHEAIARTEVFSGQMVPPPSTNKKGRPVAAIRCPLLNDTASYAGFNGNKARKGRGYRLETWMQKCGYKSARELLDDLGTLSERLSLTVAAILPKVASAPKWLNLAELSGLNESRPNAAKNYHVRIYCNPSFIDEWSAFFGWNTNIAGEGLDVVDKAHALLIAHKIPRGEAADALGVDRSTFSKMLNRRRRMPQENLDRLHEWISTKGSQQSVSHTASRQTGAVGTVNLIPSASPDMPMLEVARSYLRRGWSVVPQISGQKHPPVKWKRFQTELPQESDLEKWWGQWPDAGIILITGPLSNVFAVDVDSTDARESLLQHLGVLPNAPTALSGSRAPDRFHLFFRHPEFPTKAKSTPWHDKLEFRGNAGLLVLPPSIHPSGNRYAWAEGRSLDEIDLPELPPEIIGALNLKREFNAPQGTVSVSSDQLTQTEADLSRHANNPGWNNRLFIAAHRFRESGLPHADAEPRLLAAAKPWNADEQDKAQRTIASAYSSQR